MAGGLIGGYAVAGALLDPDADPLGVVLFTAAVVVVHDVVLMPLALAAGAVTRGRPALRIAGLVALPVLLVGAPLALGYGRPVDNPSALPLPYPRNLALILVLIAGTAMIGKGIARFRRGRRRARTR